MEQFDFKRFWKVFRCELSNMYKVYLVYGAIVVAITLSCWAIVAFPRMFGYEIRHFAEYFLKTGVDSMYIFVLCSGVMFAFSGMNKTMIPELMKPASVAEKFWAKYAVCWLIPTLFAFSLIWLFPNMYHVESIEQVRLFDDNGDRIPMVILNGTVVDEATFLELTKMPPRWQMFRFNFFVYLCFSGLMLLIGAIFFKKATPKMFGPLVGFLVFLSVIIPNFIDRMEIPDFVQSIVDYIKSESYRITIFQLTFGFSVVAICTAIAYRRFCRLTLK